VALERGLRHDAECAHEWASMRSGWSVTVGFRMARRCLSRANSFGLAPGLPERQATKSAERLTSYCVEKAGNLATDQLRRCQPSRIVAAVTRTSRIGFRARAPRGARREAGGHRDHEEEAIGHGFHEGRGGGEHERGRCAAREMN
jgi:hypothetical protein